MNEDLIARFKQMLDDIDGDKYKWIKIKTKIPYISEIHKIYKIKYTISYDPRWKWNWSPSNTSDVRWLDKEEIIEWYTMFVNCGIGHTIKFEEWIGERN